MRATHEVPKLPVLHSMALTRLSDDEFFELCQANPALRFEHNAHQQIIITSPTGSESSESSTESQGQLWRWRWNCKAQLGYVYESSAGFKLPGSAMRSPDVAMAEPGQAKAAHARATPPVSTGLPGVYDGD